MDSFLLNLTGLTRYRGHEGQTSFLLHRLTGLGTLAFLAIHILDTSTVYFFPSLYNHAIGIYQSTPFMLGEIILVFCVIFHGVNGARLAFFDLFAPKAWNLRTGPKTATYTLAVAIIFWLPAAFIMARALLINNFGL